MRMLSVIIPTCNAAPWLGEQLALLSRQTLLPDEILVVDSASTDGTQDIARNAPQVELIPIARQSFDHGGTRSMAARHSRGDVLVFLTQDALPANEHCLSLLTKPLRENTQIAVTYGRQLPHRDATPFATHLRLFNYPALDEKPRCFADRQQMGLRTIFSSNSCAAYRRDALAAAGYFPEQLLLGEDTYTVAKILELGYCVQYCHEAQVFHSHNYTIKDEVRRYFDIGAFHADASELLATYGGAGGTGRRFVFSELRYLSSRRLYQLLPLSLLRSAMKLIAYKMGRKACYLPKALARRLSMRPGWWS